MLNSLLWSGPDSIINVHDSIQNPDQTQIFYKSGQTYLTWIKCDLDDLDDPDKSNRFQSRSINPRNANFKIFGVLKLTKA